MRHADDLAGALKLDMGQWFTPTASNFFAKISKQAMLDSIAEAKGTPDSKPSWVLGAIAFEEYSCKKERPLRPKRVRLFDRHNSSCGATFDADHRPPGTQ